MNKPQAAAKGVRMSAERKRAILMELMQSVKMAKPIQTPSGMKVFVIGVWVDEIQDFLNWTVPHCSERGDNLASPGTSYPMNMIIEPMIQRLEGVI